MYWAQYFFKVFHNSVICEDYTSSVVDENITVTLDRIMSRNHTVRNRSHMDLRVIERRPPLWEAGDCAPGQWQGRRERVGVKTVREIQGSKAESVLRKGDAGAVNTTNHCPVISYTAERDENICNIVGPPFGPPDPSNLYRLPRLSSALGHGT